MSNTARGLIRQGDVLLVPVDELPQQTWPETPDGRRHVLARGEATGHAHAIADPHAEVRVTKWRARRFVVVRGDTPAALTHDQHNALLVPAGVYEIRRQREFDPETWGDWVAD